MKNLILPLIIVGFLLVSSCTSLLLHHHHDLHHPCSDNGQMKDSVVCEQWKKNYPNEYKHYQKRLEKRSKLD